MIRWHIYSYLKRTNGQASFMELREIAEGDEYELHEGIKEYNDMASESEGFFRPFINRGGY